MSPIGPIGCFPFPQVGQPELNLPPLSAVDDRLMVCGSIGLNRDIATMITAAGFTEGTMNDRATFVVERAFVGDGAL